MRILTITLVVVLATGTLAFTYGDWGFTRSDMRRVVLPAGEVHEGWYFAGGDQVSILGTVNGDAYVAGGVVEVEGTINGELIVAGGQVNVSGTVTDRIIAAGGSVRVTGKTGKSVIAAGGTIVIGRGATIGDNLLAAGGNLQINGTVAREARVAGGQIELTDTVRGNMDVTADRFNSYKGALVGGNLSVLTSDSEKVSVEHGTVVGNVHVAMKKTEEQRYIFGMRKFAFCFQLILSLTLFVTALALSFLLPRHLTVPGTVLMDQPGQSILWGVIVLIVAPFVALVLCVTVIGIPIGLLLMAVYGWFLYLSQLVLGVAIGSRFFGLEGKKGWALFGTVAVGLLVVEVMMFVPILRLFVALAGLIVGVGALSIATKGMLAKARANVAGPATIA